MKDAAQSGFRPLFVRPLDCAYHAYRYPALSTPAGRSDELSLMVQEGGDGAGHEQRDDPSLDAYESSLQERLEAGYQAGYEAGRQEVAAAPELKDAQDTENAHAKLVTLAATLDRVHTDLDTWRESGVDITLTDLLVMVQAVAQRVVLGDLATKPEHILTWIHAALEQLPPSSDVPSVYLPADIHKRLSELFPERAAQWHLVGDTGLDSGECRVTRSGTEVDAGCSFRLEMSAAALREQLQKRRFCRTPEAI